MNYDRPIFKFIFMNFDAVLRILFALSTISCEDPTVHEERSSLLKLIPTESLFCYGFPGGKRFGTFEKRAPGVRFSKVPKALRARKVSGSFKKRAPGHFQSKIVFSLWVTIAVDHQTKTIRKENQLGSQPASTGHVKYQLIIKYLFRTSQRDMQSYFLVRTDFSERRCS